MEMLGVVDVVDVVDVFMKSEVFLRSPHAKRIGYKNEAPLIFNLRVQAISEEEEGSMHAHISTCTSEQKLIHSVTRC
jgi:hypothetical protein